MPRLSKQVLLVSQMNCQEFAPKRLEGGSFSCGLVVSHSNMHESQENKQQSRSIPLTKSWFRSIGKGIP